MKVYVCLCLSYMKKRHFQLYMYFHFRHTSIMIFHNFLTMVCFNQKHCHCKVLMHLIHTCTCFENISTKIYRLVMKFVRIAIKSYFIVQIVFLYFYFLFFEKKKHWQIQISGGCRGLTSPLLLNLKNKVK